MDNVASFLDFLKAFASEIWMTTCEVSPYLIMGLILAGILHIFVPTHWVRWALGPMKWKGAFRGAVVGAPLPLCSCSVLPTAIALRRQGASLSASTAFMISTPETSIDSIAITLALLPTSFAFIRPIAAIALAVCVGVFVEFMSSSKKEERVQNLSVFSNEGIHDHEASQDDQFQELCRVCGLHSKTTHHHSMGSRLRSVFRYSFMTFFEDIGVWLVFGIVFAALINVSIPDTLFRSDWWMTHPNAQILLAVTVGIPLYSCATATTPLAAALMAKGLNPGAVLVLLLSGPATNIGSYFGLRRQFGVRYTASYYASMVVLCVVIGIILNLIWPLFQFFPTISVLPQRGTNIIHQVPWWLEVISAWVIIVLILKLVAQNLFVRRNRSAVTSKHAHKHNHTHHHEH